MNDTELRDRLRELPVPGEHEAEERAWRLVRAALERRDPVRRPTHRVRYALGAAAALVLVAVALTPPGAAIGRWIRAWCIPGAAMRVPGCRPFRRRAGCS